MLVSYLFGVIVATASVASAVPAYGASNSTWTTAATAPSQTINAEACSQLSVSSVKAAATPDSNGFTHVDFDLAYDCLASIPLDPGTNIDFIEELQKYVQFQSTISYLKNPPAGSDQVPVDLVGGLNAVAQAVQSGEITGQFDFETAVQNVIGAAHDGHLAVNFVITNMVFWGAPFGLVSISTDGVALPKVFTTLDIGLQIQSAIVPSAVVQIDGQDVVSYLTNLTFLTNSQSTDARYNTAFASINPNSLGSFLVRQVFPGKNSFSLTFENGTTTTYSYFAILSVQLNLDGINTGAAWYENLALATPSVLATAAPIATSPPTQVVSAPAGSSQTVANELFITNGVVATLTDTIYLGATPTPPALHRRDASPPLVLFNQPFPDTPEENPFIQDANSIIGGFFLKDTSNTAVIDITSFEGGTNDVVPDDVAFQAALEQFLAKCKADGTKHLIIDVRGNGGGIIEIGFELYKQLFPSSIPYSGTRFHANEASVQIATVFSTVTPDDLESVRFDSANGGANFTQLDELDFQIGASGYDMAIGLDINNKHFTTFESFFGPVTVNGDNFSDIIRMDPSDEISFGSLPGSFSITGYNARANLSTQPDAFSPENIILLTDGQCASTCTIFSEFLQNQQGVKSVVVGGRPSTDTSPAIGGTRGTEVAPFANLLNLANIVRSNFTASNAAQQKIWDDVLPNPLPLALSAAQLNQKDNIRKNDPAQQPLQFYVEPADCRVFLTTDTFSSSIKLWTYVEQIAWGTGAKCAVGSLSGVGTISVTVGGNSTIHATTGSSSKTMTPGKWIMANWGGSGAPL